MEVKSTSSALKWRTASAVVSFAGQFIVSVVLARLLLPETFGLLSMATLFLTATNLISEIGIVPALIQRANLTEKHLQVGFTISMILGVVLTGILILLAPLASLTFGIPELEAVVRLLSFSLLIRSVAVVSDALLQRQLQFKVLFVADFVSFLLGRVIIAIVLALILRDVWALVWSLLAEVFIRSIILVAVRRPPKQFSLAASESRALLRFGIGTSLARVANYTAANGDYLVVGRQLGPAPLGLYTRAYQLMALPTSFVTTVLSSVLFPVYSRIQEQPLQLKRLYRVSLMATTLLTIPSMFIAVVVAPELIVGLYGEQWVGSVVPFQIMCLAAIFRAVYPLGDALARAKGYVYHQLGVHSLYASLVLIGSLIGSRWGITGVAVGVTFALFVTNLTMAGLVKRLIPLTYPEFVKMHAPGTLLGMWGAGVALVARYFLTSWGMPFFLQAVTTLCIAVVAVIAAFVVFGKYLLRDLYTPIMTQVEALLPSWTKQGTPKHAPLS